MVAREIDSAITVEWLIMLTLVVAGERKVDSVVAAGIMHRVHHPWPAGRQTSETPAAELIIQRYGGEKSIDDWPI